MEVSNAPLLTVDDLSVTFRTPDGEVRAVAGASFSIAPGEVLAVVGESGSGKSVTALALMRLHPKNTDITGSVTFDGIDLLDIDDKQMQQVRGRDIAMIFQDPMTALNPVFTVGSQIVEMIRLHSDASKSEAFDRAVDLLTIVGVPEPRSRAEQYPHEFSGGMRQRAMIAMAIANEPKLLIADEPTTALDVTVQAQVMEVLQGVQQQTGSAMMLITHDLGLVAGVADRVQVMYASRVMEAGDVEDVFYGSRNPYTMALLNSIPDLEGTKTTLQPIPGNPPSLLSPPPGCAFSPRCSLVADVCRSALPELVDVSPAHRSRCHRIDALPPVEPSESVAS
jgi:oligopeptide/dipeptide ABC transporter ATP-binding protein